MNILKNMGVLFTETIANFAVSWSLKLVKLEVRASKLTSACWDCETCHPPWSIANFM